MAEKLTFKVNGIERTVEYEPEMMLIDVIRDVLDLTGTKRGCDNSTCGTCVVVMNGKSIKSCNTPAIKAAGAEVVTVEGLAKGTELHPIQTAIAELCMKSSTLMSKAASLIHSCSNITYPHTRMQSNRRSISWRIRELSDHSVHVE